jgi:hypothetical protein
MIVKQLNYNKNNYFHNVKGIEMFTIKELLYL